MADHAGSKHFYKSSSKVSSSGLVGIAGKVLPSTGMDGFGVNQEVWLLSQSHPQNC